MLARKIIQRGIFPNLNKRFLCIKKDADTLDLYGKIVSCSSAAGVFIGINMGSYNGYMLNRHKTYGECALETTSSGFIGAGFGLVAGWWLGLMAPITLPICCICIPISAGSVLIKYFDKNAK